MERLIEGFVSVTE